MKLTENDAQEVLHKLAVLADSEDLQEDYRITREQAEELRDSVPWNGGEWSYPDWAAKAVQGEMEDHCDLLLDVAADARSGGETGQALRIAKQSHRLRAMFVKQEENSK